MSFERRKVRVGRVVGDKMEKTVAVLVEWRTSHSLYRKAIRRRTRFKAHDAKNECRIGDLVRLVETRPISKTKRWKVVEILAREDIAELQPDDIAVDETVMSVRGTAAEESAVAVVAAEEAPDDEPDASDAEAIEDEAVAAASEEAEGAIESEEAVDSEAAEEPQEAEVAASVEEETAEPPAESEEAVEPETAEEEESTLQEPVEEEVAEAGEAAGAEEEEAAAEPDEEERTSGT